MIVLNDKMIDNKLNSTKSLKNNNNIYLFQKS